MSRKAIKSINWTAIAERIPDTEKNMFAAFKAKSDQYLRRMMANPESSPKIDWSYYRKTVTTPGLVDKFQKEYETLSVPYPSDKYTVQLEAEEKQLNQKIEGFIQEANQLIAESQCEIERIKNLLPFNQMTLEDWGDMYPEEALNPENPTAWPHTLEVQPWEEAKQQQQNDH